MPIVKRTGLGRPLTYAELDGNFDALTDGAAALSAALVNHQASSNPHPGLTNVILDEVGAVSTTLQQAVSETVSGMRFMTPEQIADVKSKAATLNVSAALQAALNTGKSVNLPDGDYYVPDSLSALGQAITGPGRIKTLKEPTIPTFAPAPAPSAIDGKIRAVYVESAWDLQDMLTIRSLGFDTVIHYGSWSNVKAGEAVGTWAKFINNAKSAGLKVIMGTEWSGATPATVTAIGDAVGSPVISYIMYDEPVGRAISRATQETKLAAYRAVTQKPLGLTEYAQAGFFVDNMARTYDFCFLDIYFDFTTTTYNIARNQALHGFGEMSVKIPGIKITPCLGLMHIQLLDMTARLKFARDFAKLSTDGSYSAFVWDGYGDATIVSSIRRNTIYRQAALDVFKTSQSSIRYKVDIYAWGTEGGPPVGLGDIIKVWRKDYSAAAVPFTVTNVGSAVDAHNSTFAKDAISYSGTGGSFATDIVSMGYVYFRGYAGNTETAAVMNFNLIASQGDWSSFVSYGSAANVPNYSVNGFVVSAAVPTKLSLGLQMSYSTAPAQYPWRFLSGMLINSNWL